MDIITDDPAAIRGIIYCIEHIATGKKYIGQTRSHRLNHGRYRPFGAEGRFRDHMSCATCNTKTDQCSALYNAVRLHGRDAFQWSQIEVCSIDDLDRCEQHWIQELKSAYPSGYNLTHGGRAGSSRIASVGISTPLNSAGERGGCTHRSAETRAKMSSSTAAAFASTEVRTQRAALATAQHEGAKSARFAGVTIDPANLDQYIYIKGDRAVVRVGTASTSFTRKGSSLEDNKQRAKEFLTRLTTTQ